MGIVRIKSNLGVPKYKQIVTSIEDAVSQGILKKGDKLPSINSIKNQHSLSRDTVLTAFNELKARGIVQSIVGKGYYLMTEDINVTQKVFLLFDEFNSFKEDLYNSFIEYLDDSNQVDIFFHHFNLDVFNKLINDIAGDYSYYVIMPANLKGVKPILDRLPNDKVFILDQLPKELSNYPSVHQNFKEDIFNGLMKAHHLISKYNKLILFSDSRQPKGISEGFKLYCNDQKFQHQIVDSIAQVKLNFGDLYVIMDDKNLIRVLKQAKKVGFKLAKDYGLISYNETLLKEVVEGGITTISTDFNLMGKTIAEMILSNDRSNIKNLNKLIIRNSL